MPSRLLGSFGPCTTPSGAHASCVVARWGGRPYNFSPQMRVPYGLLLYTCPPSPPARHEA